MTHTPEIPNPREPEDHDSVARGADDRRGTVKPAEDPAPRSPERDEEAIRKGEDVLKRVKPY